ncbi:hypothetical protein BGW38_005284 [Lunasporangiospora selenospora]|uniref:Cytochrome P450 n=1 Tax=Lunasporangiospora selenospora TaxID=979761 RepID=A0A9P6KHC5_9FUNG|nr:hypothetical protein BGW38_005284 [Lunasporangiospora selenospora]
MSSAISTTSLSALFQVIKARFLQGTRTRPQRVKFFAFLSLVLLLLKYPNRAIGTRARPDLKAISWKGAPLIGNTITVLKNRNKFLQALVEGFESVEGNTMATTILGLGQIIAINDNILLEHILKTNFENYEKGFIINSLLSQVLGNGIFNSDGTLWKMHRKTASHVFSTKIYRSLIEGTFTDHSHHLCTVLERAADSGVAVDLQALFLRMTLDAFAQLSFGLDINSLGKDGRDPFGTAFDFAVVSTDERFMNPLWRITERLTSRASQMRKAVAVIDSYAFEAIRRRRGETTEEALIRQGPAGPQALSWMYYEVMVNPAVEKNLWQEVDHLDEKATYEMLTKDMRYTHAVFQEALRLYPPVPRNLKTAVADDVLPNGIQVKAGDRIMFSTYAIGRNKEVWGPQAPEFLPERWFEGTTAEVEKGDLKNSTFDEPHVWPKVRKESQYKFSSFNAGPRICLGQTFATLEALTVIKMVSSRFQLVLVPGQAPPEPVPSLTLPMKNPLLVNVVRRK